MEPSGIANLIGDSLRMELLVWDVRTQHDKDIGTTVALSTNETQVACLSSLITGLSALLIRYIFFSECLSTAN